METQLRRGTYITPEQRDAHFRVYYQRWAAVRRISDTRRQTRPAPLGPVADQPHPPLRHRRLDRHPVPRTRTGIGARLLRGPLRRAVRDGIITDPCIDIKLPKLNDITKTFDDVLSAAEVDRLVAAFADPTTRYAGLRTNHRYQALVFMGAWLGPRWNEAIGLRLCDLNPDRHELTLGRQVINQNGSHTFTKTGSKTGDWRTIPVPSPVMAALTAHLDHYQPGARRDDLVFTNNRGGHILRGNFTRDALAPAVTRAGLDDRRVTWLTLRHTAASLMFDAGLTLFEVQHRLGHKSPTLTAKIYTHLMRERFDEGRQRLETYMTEKRSQPPHHPHPHDSEGA